MYGCAIHGREAIKLMIEILPWMGKRRSEKIKEIIQIWDTRPTVQKFKIAEQIRKEYQNNTQQELADKYHMSPSNVGYIVNYKTRRIGG